MEHAAGSTFSASMASVSHHWKELTLRNGTVMSAAPGKAEAEYLATPEVKIVGKKDAVPERDDPRVAFFLQLNCAPDPIWQKLFASNLEDVPPGIIRPELKVEFQDNQLRLVCLASHLERIYPFIKSTVEETNTDYQQEKESVLQHVTAAEAHKHPPVPLAGPKSEIARDKFSQLEL